MGNSFGCSASGERLVSAARDGDVVEAKMLLDCNPCLSKYSTFGGLNSPLHFAAAKGHNEVDPCSIFSSFSETHECFDPIYLQLCGVCVWLLIALCGDVDCGIVAREWS
ncbi:unnamed protein product [Ilex paraguariensis]|uniref:Uncharacterized protein n=1 Tax=Ilex paraguariensis TaxID=185542 RepID=A0ABC8T1V6_9AQUA